MERLKKHDNLIIVFIIAILLLGNCFNFYLKNSDEAINFLNIYKMTKGLEIYKDTNVIITPLFFYIGELFFKIFDNNIFVFRVYNLILATTMYLLCYIILKELKIRKLISLLCTLFIMLFTYNLFLAGANYNILSFILFEFGILILLKSNNLEEANIKRNSNKINKYTDFLQGLILFLIIFSNHKLGCGYFGGLVVYYIILNKEKKEIIRSITKVILVNAVLFFIYAIYLYLNNNLYNFINYTVLGIIEFGNKNMKLGIQNVFSNIKYISILLITLITNAIVRKSLKKLENMNKEVKIEEYKIEEYKKNSNILIIFSICSIILIIPILNEYHIALCTILFLISIIYSLNFFILPILKEKSLTKVLIILNLAIIIIMGIKSIKDMTTYINELKNIHNTSPLYGGVLQEDLKKEIDEITNYIENQKQDVIILSTYAPIYSIELNDLKNGVYDWALRGNLGKDGELGLIEKIKKLKNTQILLLDETEERKELYQFAYEAREYIENNMRYLGKIRNFNIYQTID